LTYGEALELIKKYVKNKNLIKHMLATAACMKELAKKFKMNEKKWELAGLIHDTDVETTDKQTHGYKTAEILKNYGVDPEIIQAILVHADKAKPERLIDKVLRAVDPLTGLIVACALIHKDKKLNSISPEFVLKRFKEKRFAAGADRNVIKSCEKFGLPLKEFVEICLKAMQNISDKLGL